MPETKKNIRPDKALIQEWKKKHGDIFQMTADDKIIIIRQPGVKDLERALASDPKNKKKFNFNRSILENCTLYKDDDALGTDARIMAFFGQLDELIPEVEAETKKL